MGARRSPRQVRLAGLAGLPVPEGSGPLEGARGLAKLAPRGHHAPDDRLGDGVRIGANAVIAPGALIRPGQVIARLSLVDQDEG